MTWHVLHIRDRHRDAVFQHMLCFRAGATAHTVLHPLCRIAGEGNFRWRHARGINRSRRALILRQFLLLFAPEDFVSVNHSFPCETLQNTLAALLTELLA